MSSGFPQSLLRHGLITIAMVALAATPSSAHWSAWLVAFGAAMIGLGAHVVFKVRRLNHYAKVGPPAESFRLWVKGRRERKQGSLSISEPVNGELSVREGGEISEVDR